MEPVFKLSPGHRISVQSHLLFVKDLTGTIGEMEYTQDYDNPDVFNAAPNETGYSPEQPRNQFALYLLAFIKTTNGDTPVVIEAYDPLVVETFHVAYTKDGWYEFRLLAVPVVTPPLPAEPVEGEEPVVEEPPVYEEGSIFFHTAHGLVQVVEGQLKPILPVTLLGTTYERTKSDKPVLTNAVLRKNALNDKKEELIFEGKTKGVEYQSVKNDYDVLRALIESAYYQFLLGNKYVFQKIAEHLDANNAC